MVKPWIAILVAIVLSSAVSAQSDDRYRLHFASPDIGGPQVKVWTLLDMQPGVLGAPVPILGWSYGVCYEPGPQILSTTYGVDVASLNGGHPPAFASHVRNPNGELGHSVGVVINFLADYSLPPGTDLRIGKTVYELSSSGSLVLHWCEIGSPTVETVLISSGVPSQTIFPTLDSEIRVAVPLAGRFLRADCDNSGSRSLLDIVTLLALLFPQAGVTVELSCADACDADDDGTIDLGDAITMVGAFFGAPASLLPEPNTCGLDPSPDDDLGCDEPPVCP